jgi:hypothetical protein
MEQVAATSFWRRLALLFGNVVTGHEHRRQLLCILLLVGMYGLNFLWQVNRWAFSCEAKYGISVLQLLLGILIWVTWCHGDPVRVNGNGVRYALGVFVSLLAVQYSLTIPVFSSAWLSAEGIGLLLKYSILVGLTEELWFRGIWFSVWRYRLVPSVCAGSIVFGFAHLAQGLNAVVFTAFIGLVYAAARYRGAGVIALGAVHGVTDWLNTVVVSGSSFRCGKSTSMVLIPVTCIMISAAILLVRPVMERVRAGH